jgi:hypothetical protein
MPEHKPVTRADGELLRDRAKGPLSDTILTPTHGVSKRGQTIDYDKRAD